MAGCPQLTARRTRAPGSQQAEQGRAQTAAMDLPVSFRFYSGRRMRQASVTVVYSL